MREVVSMISLTPGDDGWQAVVPWVDDARGVTGHLAVGPESDAVDALVGLVLLIRDLRWPWVRLLKSDDPPCVWVPPEADFMLDSLTAWAAPQGWRVAVVPSSDTAAFG